MPSPHGIPRRDQRYALRMTAEEKGIVQHFADTHRVSFNTAVCRLIEIGGRLAFIADTATTHALAPRPATTHPTIAPAPGPPRTHGTLAAPGPLFREPPSAPDTEA